MDVNTLQRYGSISIDKEYVNIELLEQKVTNFEMGDDGIIYIPIHEYAGAEEDYLNEFSNVWSSLESSLNVDTNLLPYYRRMYHELVSIGVSIDFKIDL